MTVLAHLLLSFEICAVYVWTCLSLVTFCDSQMYEQNDYHVATIMLISLLAGALSFRWLPDFSRIICVIFSAWTIWCLPGMLSVCWNFITRPPHISEQEALSKAGDKALEHKNLATAEQYYSELFDKQKSGYCWPKVWATVLRLGDVLETEGKFDEAEQVCNFALQDSELMSNGNQPLYGMDPRITCYQNLASIYLRQKRYGEAERLFKKVLKMHESVTYADDREVAACHEELAQALKAQGKVAEAKFQNGGAKVLRDERENELIRLYGHGDR